MVPHLVFIVHFIFSLKRVFHTVYSLYMTYIIMGMKIESFVFCSVSFFHGASIALTDCNQNFKGWKIIVSYLGLPFKVT